MLFAPCHLKELRERIIIPKSGVGSMSSGSGSSPHMSSVAVTEPRRETHFMLVSMFFLSSLSLSRRSVTMTSLPKRAAMQLRKKKIRKVYHRMSKNKLKNNSSSFFRKLRDSLDKILNNQKENKKN